MRIFEEAFPIDIHPALLPDEASQVVFFDIETTGFSGQSAFLYLIGCIFLKDGSWQIRQWFLDDFKSEKELLLSFFDFISSYTWLIHFNGSTFDIPFIEKRLARYKLSKSFSFFESLDLYKELKPYKALLGLSGLKQKNLEEFLGIYRTDQFTGGELIEVYYEYMDTHRDELLSCLLLHNADDLRGMLSILPLHGLLLLLKGNFEVTGHELKESELIFSLKSPLPLPPSLQLCFHSCKLMIDGRDIFFVVPLIKETLKYFYPNPKDYYYLPAEDQAIHKSVAAYVDKAYRVAANQSNCYTKRTSAYLPLKDRNFVSTVFQRNYKEKEYFFELNDEFLNNRKLQKEYVLQLL